MAFYTQDFKTSFLYKYFGSVIVRPIRHIIPSDYKNLVNSHHEKSRSNLESNNHERKGSIYKIGGTFPAESIISPCIHSLSL